MWSYIGNRYMTEEYMGITNTFGSIMISDKEIMNEYGILYLLELLMSVVSFHLTF